MNRRRLLAALPALAPLAAGCGTMKRGARQPFPPTVGFVQLRTTDLSSDIRDGVLQALNAGGYVEGEGAHFLLKNADGSTESASQIARDFAKQRVDLIAAVGPGIVPAVLSAANEIPVLAAGCTTEEAAAAGQGLFLPAEPPIEEGLSLVRALLGGEGKIGVVASPDGADAAAALARLRASTTGGPALVETHVTSVDELPAALTRLKDDGARLLLHVPGSLADVWASDLVAPADETELPVVSLSPEDVHDGLAAARGFSFFEFGRLAGGSAVSLLRRAAPASTATPEITCAFDAVVCRRYRLAPPGAGCRAVDGAREV